MVLNGDVSVLYVCVSNSSINYYLFKCFYLFSHSEWEWISDGSGCEVVGDIDKEVNEAMCRCYHLGMFAITTDMYDVNVSQFSLISILSRIVRYKLSFGLPFSLEGGSTVPNIYWSHNCLT